MRGRWPGHGPVGPAECCLGGVRARQPAAFTRVLGAAGRTAPKPAARLRYGPSAARLLPAAAWDEPAAQGESARGGSTSVASPARRASLAHAAMLTAGAPRAGRPGIQPTRPFPPAARHLLCWQAVLLRFGMPPRSLVASGLPGAWAWGIEPLLTPGSGRFAGGLRGPSCGRGVLSQPPAHQAAPHCVSAFRQSGGSPTSCQHSSRITSIEYKNNSGTHHRQPPARSPPSSPSIDTAHGDRRGEAPLRLPRLQAASARRDGSVPSIRGFVRDPPPRPRHSSTAPPKAFQHSPARMSGHTRRLHCRR